MAFPTVSSTATTDGTGATATPAVDLPATVNVGDTIIVLIRVAVAGAIGWPDASWNEMFDASSDAADDQMALAWRKANGTEGGTSITLSSGNGKFAALAYSITGADPDVRPPQLSTVATGTSTTPNPTAVTPTGGTKDYLWLWLGGWENEQTSPPTGQPTNYTDPIGASSGTAGAVTTNCRVASARRTNTASTEDPGSWTISVSDDWTAYTMAIHPPPVALVGASDAVSTAGGTITNVVGLAAASAATSTGASALAITRPLTTAVTATSTAAATLTKTVPLTGASAATSTATSDLDVATGLMGAVAATSTATSRAVATFSLAGTATGTSTTASDITRTVGLAASTTGISTAGGTATASLVLLSTVNATSSATSTALISRNIAGAANAISTAAASVTRMVGLSATVNATSSTAASMEDAVLLIGAAAGVSSITSGLTLSVGLRAQSDGTSTGAGSVTGTFALNSLVSGTSSSTSVLRPDRGLNAATAATSTTSSAISLVRPLAGTTAATSTAAALVGLSVRLTGATAGVSGGLGELNSGAVTLQGTVTAVSTFELHFPHEPVILTLQRVKAAAEVVNANPTMAIERVGPVMLSSRVEPSVTLTVVEEEGVAVVRT